MLATRVPVGLRDQPDRSGRFGPNVGVLDRVLRLALGTVAAIAAGSVLEGTPSLLAWAVAIDALVTGSTGFSLLYDTFDLDTRSAEARARPGQFAA